MLITIGIGKRGFGMDIQKGDTLVMKKKHPCGSNEMLVLRTGMDLKLRCVGCGREFMIPRSKGEKNIKSINKDGNGGTDGR